MASLVLEPLRTLSSSVDNYLDSAGHPFGNLHFPGAPWKLTGMVLLYLVFVLKVGPNYMKNRKAFKLESLMRMYNFVNVLVNLILFTVAMYYTKFGSLCWQCIGIYDYECPEWAKYVGVYMYMYLKVFDLMDTVFFVLRKKDSQITVLHLFHHSSMPLSVYIGVKLAPQSPTTMIGILNSFVHIVMYTYYFLASYGPQMQPYLWWKKHLTAIQLAQFAILLVHSTVILFTPNCQYPKLISFLMLAKGAYFSYAFGMFYIRSYRKTSGEDSNNNVEKEKSQ